MDRILSKNVFESVLPTVDAREREIQEWMDGKAQVEYSNDQAPVFCFVALKDFSKVTLLRFATTEDMDAELGELERVDVFMDEQVIHLPVSA